MCREVAVLELTAEIPDVQLVQMWVCDLVMSRTAFQLRVESGKLKVICKVITFKTKVFGLPFAL